jgi:hypothetical protein
MSPPQWSALDSAIRDRDFYPVPHFCKAFFQVIAPGLPEGFTDRATYVEMGI